MQQICFSTNAAHDIAQLVGQYQPDHIFILTDRNTNPLCQPLLAACPKIAQAHSIVIEAGDEHKTLPTLADVWNELSNNQASRHSLLINFGGGMVTDLGGFAAATFKRGIRFIHVPTTLLAMVDAAVGGKTGINLNGLKNEVGSFCEALAVIIDANFLRTLDTPNLRSGFAEMLKHALLNTRELWTEHLQFNLAQPNYALLQKLIEDSIATKQRIVKEDPYEKGIRKALNLGHTVGHALESWALERKHPVLHGYAVAWGLICELYLSAVSLGFPTDVLRQTTRFIRSYYGFPTCTCKDYEHLYKLMLHDKKNTGNVINFTLLTDIGNIRINCQLKREDIYESLDFLREG